MKSFCRRLSGCLLLALGVFAGISITLPSFAQSPPPALLVEGKERSTPLAISKVDVDVSIHGFIAETKMTLTFHNGLNRQLAGDLYFPIPEGSTVSGYALDVNRVMVNGVAVEKDKARQVFEKETRKGVDPGLVEWTRGNHFKTRVFPIPARGNRKVSVSYLSEITTDASGSCYELPLNFKQPLKEFHIRVEVMKAQAKPVTVTTAPLKLDFGKWQENYVAETTRTNVSLTGELAIQLPEVERQRVIVEKASDGQYYFCVNEAVPDPRPVEKQPWLPVLRQMTIYWDASGSRGNSDHERELEFLKKWFSKYSQLKLTVNLVPFRNVLAPAQRFTIANGDATELLNAISNLTYDGGTQLGCLTNDAAMMKDGCYFLFTDGLSTFGKMEPATFNAPLYIFTADQIVDEPFLQNLAQRSGGTVIPLRRVDDVEALRLIASKPFAFMGVATPALGGFEYCPQTASIPEGRLTLAGKLKTGEAKMMLNYGAAGKAMTQTPVHIAQENAVSGDLLRRYWAQKKLAELLVFQKRNESEITELGKRYGIVTPYTSLMVLETLEQYVEHRILPPVTIPKMRKEYARIVEENDSQVKAKERGKTEHLLALWNQRVDWWNQKFSYKQGFKYSEEGEQITNGLVHRFSRVTPLPGAALNTPAPMAPSPDMSSGLPATANWTHDAMEQDRSRFAAAKGEPGEMNSALPHFVREAEPGVVIKEWNPQTPYLQALKKASTRDAYAVYLTQRKKFGDSPGFYLDCADSFRKQKQEELGLQVLSNIAELDLDDAALLRILAYRLLQIGQIDLACDLFEQVPQLRPEEPQSFRDLALALAQRGLQRNDPGDCRRALALLAKVVNNKWDRFDEIEVIALMELNALYADCGRHFPKEKFDFPVDARLKKLLDLDIRILLTWDSDMTDMDVHVIEPSGEEAFYGHNLTTIGGLVSHDFTEGYGPEEYCLRKAMSGTYKIEVNYYGNQAAKLTGPITVQAEVITHFGRPNEKRRSLTLRLVEKKETVRIGEVEF